MHSRLYHPAWADVAPSSWWTFRSAFTAPVRRGSVDCLLMRPIRIARSVLAAVTAAACCWCMLSSMVAVAEALAPVEWSFDPNAHAGAVVTLVITGLPSIPGIWIAVAPVDAPIGAYSDWDYAPSEQDSVRLRLPDLPQPLEFRLYQDNSERTQLLASSESFVPVPLEAALDAPVEVTAATRFEVFWTGPNRISDVVVLVDPVLPAVEVDHAPTALGNPLTLTAPWTPGRYQLRYLTGVDQVVLTSFDIEVIEVDAAAPADECAVPPSETSLLEAFEAELNAMAGMARVTYGVEDARYSASAHIAGREGVVDASYVLELTDRVTRDSVTLEGTASARFSWTGCGWMLVGVTY